MLMLLFKVSLTVSFMPREEYIVGTFALTNACPTQNDSEGRTQINERLIVTHRCVLEHCGTLKDCVFPKTHVSLELLPPLCYQKHCGQRHCGLLFLRLFFFSLCLLPSLNQTAPN